MQANVLAIYDGFSRYYNTYAYAQSRGLVKLCRRVNGSG